MTKKLRISQFFVRVNPNKIEDFRQPKGQITLMRNLGSKNNYLTIGGKAQKLRL